ncbi:hypothetical protein HU200_062353 [Digitaria exilis]|uniref:UDP-N-acetylglucosamine transferase subunit ALG14 n=1 Tax=Digitaria exilis TaxID=1010633 RepID=A0A835DZQ8_9POAL|nr:hypothetical protein HU200_062353 [Digitaria exilis]
MLVSLLAIRFVYMLWRSDQPSSRSPTAGLRCLIVLGSGEYVLRGGQKTIKNAYFMLIYRIREIFYNGPGTCFPLCVCFLSKIDDVSSVYNEFEAAVFQQVLGFGWSSIFYIESIARVKKLSLSGLLLYKLRIANQFFVQWPQLQQKYPRAYYAGHLL